MMLVFFGVVALFIGAIVGVVYSAWRRGWPWLMAIPFALAVLALNGSGSGPLPAWIRYLAAFGIPLGTALPLVLPVRATSYNSESELDPEKQARRNRRAIALGWVAVFISLIWTWYLLMDPSSCLGGGCG